MTDKQEQPEPKPYDESLSEELENLSTEELQALQEVLDKWVRRIKRMDHRFITTGLLTIFFLVICIVVFLSFIILKGATVKQIPLGRVFAEEG